MEIELPQLFGLDEKMQSGFRIGYYATIFSDY